MAEEPIVQVCRSGASSLIKKFCDEIDLVAKINHAITFDPKQWKVSPGHHILALVINTLTGRDPLYRVERYYETQDVEVLFGAGVTAHDFNNDAIGRTLDRLHAANPKALMTSITLESLLTEDKPLIFAHADTTSKSLQGAYNHEKKDGVVHITRGYSKDNHPDLKQIMFGLITSQGTPLFGNVDHGNQDDPTWNADRLEDMFNELTPAQLAKIVYVADSKFFSKDNVLKAHGGNNSLKFITLVSEQHSIRSQAIETVLKSPDMTDIGRLSPKLDASEYKIQEWKQTFHGVDLRLVVVHSTQLFQTKKATFERALHKEKEKLEKEGADMEKKMFSCETDAKKAWKEWQKAHKKSLFPVECRIETTTRPAKREVPGRPKKSEQPKMETVYSLHIDIAPVPPEVMAEKEKQMGYFVLATNVLDQEQLPTEEVLREYKEQSSVELRFKFLKDPAFVDALFLNTPERIEALGYVLLIALFIYATMEKRLRLALEQSNIRLQPVRGHYTNKPTARTILLLLENVTTIFWYDRDEAKWRRKVTYNDEVQKVFDLLGLDSSFYTKVPNE
jgi:transposase